MPTWEGNDMITDRTRKESDSVGKLYGNAQHSARNLDASQALGETHHFEGIDFRTIRKQQAALVKSKIPQSLLGIGHLWQEICKLKTKRERKNRIMLVESKESGYGKPVPVLKSNDYNLKDGESSVFDRELKDDSKTKFQVAKQKCRAFGHQDFCQVCRQGGSSSGFLSCPWCPCFVYVQCVVGGLTRAKDFQAVQQIEGCRGVFFFFSTGDGCTTTCGRTALARIFLEALSSAVPSSASCCSSDSSSSKLFVTPNPKETSIGLG
ncbi:unnamed protein product [Cylindrotheca closterium]|uniref:Uncharacterized protein n=1 Tax=Cylindrotheca closterium TaxID=2856 RepID=A0AAD2G795_9STRA|nr:unnamed protein product [Cylindrotheca closterium]